jgi:hypothetical protein
MRFFLKYVRDKVNTNKVSCKAKKILYKEGQAIVVKNGPFKGMIYPSYKAAGSSLWPKLLGTYEKELQTFIRDSLKTEYKYIIDIGCAEGYYAVGYALNAKYDKIIAYDVDIRARNLCYKMCKTNQVDIEIRDFCTNNELESFDFSNDKKSLIFVDCEGYERELLTKIDSNKLRNAILIVEIHDWCQYEDETMQKITDCFSGTHNYRLITGCDDYEKAYKYNVDEIKDLNIQDRFYLLREGRKRLGKWLILDPKVGLPING